MGWSLAPVGAPGDGGNKAYVREQDGVVFYAIQGVVHLTQRQPVQLKLQLHLQPAKHRQSVQLTFNTWGGHLDRLDKKIQNKKTHQESKM